MLTAREISHVLRNLKHEFKISGPAEALRQRRLSPQCFFPVKIRFFDPSAVGF